MVDCVAPKTVRFKNITLLLTVSSKCLMGLLFGIIILDTPLDTDLILCLLMSLSIAKRFEGSEYPISLVESDLAIFVFLSNNL